MPADPHIKDRSRCQEAVADTCLRLDRPDLAEQYAQRIDNWRRGSAFADIAIYRARRNELDEARRAMAAANAVADAGQDWRNERVKAKLEQANAMLGANAMLEAPAAEPSGPPSDQEVRARIAEVAPIAERGNFDEIRGVLEGCVVLYGRAFGNADHRTLIEGTITASWTRLPIAVRVELLMSLATTAVEHHDRSRALALVEQAEGITNGATWLPEEHVPALARIAALRSRAGDAAGALQTASAALAAYRASREQTMNFDRADALRPLGEAYGQMNERAKALAIYRLAIDEGAENPNARPRAEDLSATCASMAFAGVEPDAALWSRIRSILGGLSDPW